MSRTHLIIPDTQVKDGVPLDHLTWIGKYWAAKKPDVVIHLGDHADMPSLSSYDKGKRAIENRRYSVDIWAANHGFDLLNQPVNDYNAMRRRNKKSLYSPEKHITLGNHEYRIERFVEDQAILEGTLSMDALNYERHGWNVHKFKKPIYIDDIAYCHFFSNPDSIMNHPVGGTAENRLNKLGMSHTQGHQQIHKIGVKHLPNGRVLRCLVNGTCYLHDEDYLGPQGNDYLRAIFLKFEVEDGNYCLMEVSLDYLCRKYEQMPLKQFMLEKYGQTWANF